MAEQPTVWAKVSQLPRAATADPSDVAFINKGGASHQIYLGDLVAAGLTDELAAGAAWFADTSAGIAGTSEGDYFSTPSFYDGVAVIIYRHGVDGVAEEVARMPSASSIHDLQYAIDAVSGSQSLSVSNPNLFTANQVAAIDAEGMTWSQVTRVVRNGVSYWSSKGSTIYPWGPFPRTDFVGDVFSAAVYVAAIEDALPDGFVRVIATQLSGPSSGDEIVEARRDVRIPVDGFKAGFVSIPNIQFHPDCTEVRLQIGFIGVGSTARIYYRDMLLCSGDRAEFRMGESGNGPNPEDEISHIRSDLYHEISSKSLAYSNPNVFSAKQASAIDDDGGMKDSNITRVVRNGVSYWKVSGGIRSWGAFDRSLFDGDIISAAVNIAAVEGVTNQNIRVLVTQYSSAAQATEITSARRETVISASNFDGGYVQVPAIQIDPACNYVRLFIGFNTGGPDMYYRDMLLCSGDRAEFRILGGDAPTPPAQSKHEVWVSTTGNDSASGTADNPLATIERAVQVLQGRGTIYVAAGDYEAPKIVAAEVKHLRLIGGARSDFKRPTFRYGTKLTPTPVSSRAGVYQSPLDRTPTWLWVDDVPDAETLVPYDEQHSLLNGRAHRLECTKIWHIDSPDASAALDEIEASPTPVCWHDAAANIIYYSLPSGASGSSSHVRAAVTGGGLMSGPVDLWRPEGRIEITGIDVRYGPVDTKYFRDTKLYDVSVLGAAADCFFIANWCETVLCRAAGAGSYAATLGDGFNAHNHAVWTFRDCYGHDCWDDGESTHENCRTTGYGSIMEYNGGGGFVPANGAQEVLHDCVSRKNAIDPRMSQTKKGGFLVTGDPISTDGGVITSLEAYNCVSIGDVNGFYDGTGSDSPQHRRLLAVGCSVIDSPGVAYACAEIIDCSETGSASKKMPGTVVRNTQTVT